MRPHLIMAGAAALLLSLIVGWWIASHRTQPIELIPTLTGEPEYCLSCHAELPEISASHPIKTFGCVICHGGERLALNADLAHSTMRGGANPSDLLVVEQSCGGNLCHSGSASEDRDHIKRVMTSIQSTYAGAIANILFTYGAQPDLRARFGIRAVSDDRISTSTGVPALEAFTGVEQANPFVREFAQNCTVCHLNAPPSGGGAFARLAGCAACHSPGARSDEGSTDKSKVHTLTTVIPYTQCNTCHNRGNYDLRIMAFVPRADHPGDRLHDYYQPIAQFTRCEYTLDCIDCHTRREAMGDGDIHSSKKEIQYIQCQTCHGTPSRLPPIKALTDPNDIAFRLAQMNPVVELQLGESILVTDQGEPLWNTRLLPDGTYELIGKATGQHFTFRPVMGSGCTQNPDQQASQYCHQCHSIQR